MSPQNDRVPRRSPSIEDQLRSAIEGIDATHREMRKIEEKALSGHYADRAHAQYENKAVYDGKAEVARPYAEREAYASGLTTLGNGVGVGPSTHQYLTPAARVGMAEADLNGLRKRLYGLCERMCGPQPESVTMQGTTSDPIPWGGSMGETAMSAERMRDCIRDMHDVLSIIETAVP